MTRTKYRSSTHSHHCPSGESGAWWFAQWLLVLVLAFDFLSAPLHHHLHDGVEGPLEFATAHALLADGNSHDESDEHPLVAHATQMVRIDASQLAQLSPIDSADVQLALVSVVQDLAAVDERPLQHGQPDRFPPDFRSHRSLPPAGRAPPLHA